MHVQLTIESPYQVVLLVNEWRHLKPEKQQNFIEFRDTYEQKLKAIISQGIEQGELQSENLEFTTNCILSSIRWLYSWYNPDNYSINSNDLEQLMIGFVLNGVAKNNKN